MKETYLVISDIHGSLSGAKMIADAAAFHRADRILCLGDVLYHGPRNDLPEDYAPKEVIKIMNDLAEKIIAVRGNCEAEADQMVLNFPCLSSCNIIPCGERRIFMTHGHIYNPGNLPPLYKGDLFLYGHTHIPEAYEHKDIFIGNPGSVALPKQNHPCTYGLFAAETFTVYTADHGEYLKMRLKREQK